MAARNNPLQTLLQSIPKPLRNKYILALLFFVGWMIFFDKHDVFTQWDLSRTVDNLEEEKAFYEEKIKEAELDRLMLETNQEEFAREKYYMKKPGEEVYIIVEEE